MEKQDWKKTISYLHLPQTLFIFSLLTFFSYIVFFLRKWRHWSQTQNLNQKQFHILIFKRDRQTPSHLKDCCSLPNPCDPCFWNWPNLNKYLHFFHDTLLLLMSVFKPRWKTDFKCCNSSCIIRVFFFFPKKKNNKQN